MVKKIIIGTDHRGFALKEFIKENMRSSFNDMLDVGCFSKDSVNYPEIATKLAQAMREDPNNFLGILICGSAVGVSIAVNRYNFIRGAVLFNVEVAKSAKRHNNANVLCLPADFITSEQALNFIKVFLEEKFEGGRHQERIDMISTC